MGYTRFEIKREVDVEDGTLYFYEAISDNNGRDNFLGTFVSLGNPNHLDSETLASRRGKPMTDKIGFELAKEARQELAD